MPFIGNQPALSYTSFAKQDFTTSATTSYTLDNPVANANELALFINFVRQEPTTAYSASGTTLTLTSATSASDDMYCVFLGKAVQTVNPPNASVGASQLVDSSIALGKLSATGTKDATTFLRGDNTFAVAGGTNTPAFRATMGSTQAISNNTFTTINFNTETYDTDSCYNTSTYRFTPNVAGKYLVIASHALSAGTSAGTFICSIFKNGAEHSRANIVLSSSTSNPITTSLIELNGSSDYIEAKGYQSTGTSKTIYAGADQSYFSAIRIIE
jgi:hypothetical protein